ncbi:hypothetical protein AA313_de0200385 [Arthrobotrys entomopaga]|nr:hypothetical protein AA313_de0200385 [Arthrobotrys entomopaga]
MFIDGLDEYDGRPIDIIRLVESLRSENVKLCVSSRPWNDFESVFGQNQGGKIYMQDLNHTDIATYVSETLESKEEFRDLIELEGMDNAMVLVNDVVKASKGVFLWVRLVVRELITGLIDGNKFHDLLTRLHSLPTDLNEFFERIIFTVDDFYRDQHHTATMFLVTLEARELLPIMTYWFIDQMNEDPDYGLGTHLQPLTEQQIDIQTKHMRKRLNAYCKGLVETQTGHQSLNKSVFMEEFQIKVDFLHRTVRDFLNTPETKKQLHRRTKADFKVELAICQASLVLIKSLPSMNPHIWGPMKHNRYLTQYILDLFFQHSTTFEEEGNALVAKQNRILMDLGEFISNNAETTDASTFRELPWISFSISPCVMLASVETGLHGFLKANFQTGSYGDGELARMLLHSVRPRWEKSHHMARPTHETVQLLLMMGASPNFELDGKTVWQTILRTQKEEYHAYYNSFKIFKVLVEYGADLDVNVPVNGEFKSGTDIIKRLFTPLQVEELIEASKESQLKRKKKKGLKGFIHGESPKVGVIKKLILRFRQQK